MYMRLLVFSLVLILCGSAWSGVPGSFSAEPNLVLEWSFENNYNDTSGSGNTGTPSGSPVFRTDTAGGPWAGSYSLEFDGSTYSDKVEDLSAANLPVQDAHQPAYSPGWSMNVLCKVNSDWLEKDYQLIGAFGHYAVGEAREINIRSGSEGYWFIAYRPNINFQMYSPHLLDEWVMLTVTYEHMGGGLGHYKSYINGVEAGVRDTTGTTETLLDTWQQVRMGFTDRTLGVYNWYDGLADEFTIWNKVLSPNEIATLYTNYMELRPYAWNPSPDNNELRVDPDSKLSWSPGDDAVSHDVYFGTDFNDVNNAGPGFLLADFDHSSCVDFADLWQIANNWLSADPCADLNDDGIVNFADFAALAGVWEQCTCYRGSQERDNNSFDPCGLELGRIYYWRVDEVNEQNIVAKGDVWKFYAASAQILSVEKIWDYAPHNAFTDLVRWNGQFYCTFREAAQHNYDPQGKVRILVSPDAESWSSAALVEKSGYDLRGPHLLPMSDGRLMLIGGLLDTSAGTGFTSFSSDGENWTEPNAVVEWGRRFWSGTTHDDTYWATTYSSPTRKGHIELLNSTDGVDWDIYVSDFYSEPNSSETQIQFDGDGNCYVLLRRDAGYNAQLGVSQSPYTDWEWHDLGLWLGGPDFIETLPDYWVGGGRIYNPTRMGLLEIDVDNFTMREILSLPSGGDCSYPGLLWYNDQLYVSYYSTHEGKTSIYFAKLKIARPRY